MATGIVSGDIMVGPGKIYTAPVGTDDSLVIATSVPSYTGWTYAGLTDGGVDFSIEKTYANHTVDQSPDWVASTITERHALAATNLVTTTLANLQLGLNSGTVTTGANWDTYTPITDLIATQETYTALLIVGNTLAGKIRMLGVRRCLSVDKLSMPFKKDSKTMYSVSWAGHFVSDTVAPFVVYTQH